MGLIMRVPGTGCSQRKLFTAGHAEGTVPGQLPLLVRKERRNWRKRNPERFQTWWEVAYISGLCRKGIQPC